MTERRATFAAAGLYAGLALLVVAQGLVPGRALSPSDYLWTAAPWSGLTPGGVRLFGANGELADAVAAFQPFTQHARAVLPSWPLWNPDISAGRPFLADMQSGVLSPFSLPSYVLPFWFSLAVVAALKLWAAAFGTFLLGRALGMRTPSALLAGLAFGFSLYMVTWLVWPLSSVWALMPWLLLAVDRAIRRPGAPAIALLALVTALQFRAGIPNRRSTWASPPSCSAPCGSHGRRTTAAGVRARRCSGWQPAPRLPRSRCCRSSSSSRIRVI